MNPSASLEVFRSWKIENDRLYQYLRENLGDFEAFKEAIRKYLKKSSS